MKSREQRVYKIHIVDDRVYIEKKEVITSTRISTEILRLNGCRKWYYSGPVRYVISVIISSQVSLVLKGLCLSLYFVKHS